MQNEFINSVAPGAIESQKEYGIPSSITISQAILESGWGNSKLSREANNYFGIKANKSWKGLRYNINTGEYDATGNYYIEPNAAFRMYATPADSLKDHADFLMNNKRYNSLFDLDNIDFKGWANGLQKAGYSTSPQYASTLINLINKYNLHSFDLEAEKADALTDLGLRNLRRFKRPLIFFSIIALAGTAAYITTRNKPKRKKLKQ